MWCGGALGWMWRDGPLVERCFGQPVYLVRRQRRVAIPPASGRARRAQTERLVVTRFKRRDGRLDVYPLGLEEVRGEARGGESLSKRPRPSRVGMWARRRTCRWTRRAGSDPPTLRDYRVSAASDVRPGDRSIFGSGTRTSSSRSIARTSMSCSRSRRPDGRTRTVSQKLVMRPPTGGSGDDEWAASAASSAWCKTPPMTTRRTGPVACPCAGDGGGGGGVAAPPPGARLVDATVGPRWSRGGAARRGSDAHLLGVDRDRRRSRARPNDFATRVRASRSGARATSIFPTSSPSSAGTVPTPCGSTSGQLPPLDDAARGFSFASTGRSNAHGTGRPARRRRS